MSKGLESQTSRRHVEMDRRWSFAGIVPAAGASRRMGRSKAGLELDGKTFLFRVVRALADGGCDPVLVVAAEGDETVASEARRAGAKVLANPDPGEGPITSLRIALGAIDDSVDGVAYLPVDHPLVQAETVSQLLEAACTAAADLTLPMHGRKRGHPAIFSRSLFGELLDPGLQGGARVVVHRHLDSALLVESTDPGVIADIDTPEAFHAAISGYVAPRVAISDHSVPPSGAPAETEPDA